MILHLALRVKAEEYYNFVSLADSYAKEYESPSFAQIETASFTPI
jgi:hypothetical protein